MRLSPIVALRLCLVVSLFLALSGRALGTTLLLDFTNSPAVETMAKWSDRIEAGSRGLGWDGPTNAYRDTWIETVPVAVGQSWRPPIAVFIRAEILPPGKFTITSNSVTFPEGQLYVRYSADKKHWSSWQNLDMQHPGSERNARQVYSGSVRAPYRERARYEEYFRKYRTMDVPWRSDEAALARWIIEQEPSFFEKQVPFVGYAQFLFETSLRAGRYLGAIKFDIVFDPSGPLAMPKDKSAWENRGGPWNFEAP